MARWMVVLLLMAIVRNGWAQEQMVLKDRKAKESYSLGYEFGSGLVLQGIDADVEIVVMAVREAIEGKKPALDGEEIRNLLKQVRRQVVAVQDRRFREVAETNQKKGKALLEKNKEIPGVKTLASGLQYQVITEGDGPMPKVTDHVKVDYRGTLINGNQFDSTYDRGEAAVVPVKGMIKGWTEALQLMKTGAKWRLFIPPDLAYGNRQFNRIPPNSTLIFELELLAIEPEPLAIPMEKEQTRVQDG